MTVNRLLQVTYGYRRSVHYMSCAQQCEHSTISASMTSMRLEVRAPRELIVNSVCYFREYGVMDAHADRFRATERSARIG